jgi:hypothetical protein
VLHRRDYEQDDPGEREPRPRPKQRRAVLEADLDGNPGAAPTDHEHQIEASNRDWRHALPEANDGSEGRTCHTSPECVVAESELMVPLFGYALVGEENDSEKEEQ